MNSIKARIDSEYAGVTLNIDAYDIISAYKKKQRRTYTAMIGATVCAVLAFSVWCGISPGSVQSFADTAGRFLSGLFLPQQFFSGETEAPTPPETTPGASSVIPATAAETDTAEVTTEETADHSEQETEEKTENEGIASPAEAREQTGAAEKPDDSATARPTYKSEETEEKTKPAEKKGRTINFKYEVLQDGTAKIISCIPKKNSLVIPEYVDGYRITVLGEKTLSGFSTVEEVDIPDSVTEIDSGAFMGLGNLRTVRMSENISEIGDRAFYNCSALGHLDLFSVKTIGSQAFYGCSSLDEAVLPKTASFVGANAYEKSGIKRAVINSDFEFNAATYTDKARIFAECASLETVIFGEGVTSIPSWCFYQCGSLKNVSLPSTLTEIGKSAFSCFVGLEQISIPDGVQKIRSRAFYKCRSLSEVKLPELLKGIGDEAFYGCYGIKSISVPAFVGEMGSMCLGYYDGRSGSIFKVPGFTISCYDDSLAKTYAVNNGFAVVSLGKPPEVTTVTLEEYIAVLKPGETYEIRFTLINPKGETQFISSDENIASVSADGAVTALSSGRADITVTNNGASRQFIVIVE